MIMKKKESEIISCDEIGRTKQYVYVDDNDKSVNVVRVKGSPKFLIVGGIIFTVLGIYGIVDFVYKTFKYGHSMGIDFYISIFMLSMFAGFGIFCFVFYFVLKKKTNINKPKIDEFIKKDKQAIENKEHDEFKIDKDNFKIDSNDY